MKKKLKSWLLEFPGFQALCRVLTRRHVRTLMYHRFSEVDEGDPRFVDRATLERQVAYICKHHLIISPQHHLDSLQGNHQGICPVAITVDDGYSDFYRLAFPVLVEYSIPAMLFVATGFVAGSTWFWWDKLAFVLDNASPGIHHIDGMKNIAELDLSTPASRHSCWHRIADKCRFINNTQKDFLIRELAVELGVNLSINAPDQFAASTWDEIREMAQKGIWMGAHTVNHPILTRVAEGEAEDEIRISQIQLEKELNRPVRFFCYPQGGPADYNSKIRTMVKKYYDGCFVAFQDMSNPQDPFTMPRYCVTGDMDHFRWAMCGAEYLGLITKKRLGMETGTAASYWTGSTDREDNNG